MGSKKGPDLLGRLGRKLGKLVLDQAARGAAADMDGVSGILYAVLTGVFPYRKKVIEKNGREALGLEGEALTEFRLGFYRHFADLVAEILAGFALSAEAITRRVTWEMDEFVHAAHENPRVVVLTGHMGNWEWQLVGGCAAFGGHVVGVYQPLSQSFFDEVMRAMRSRGGATLTPQRQLLRTLAALPPQKPTVLAMVADQAPPVENAYVLPFLDTETGFYTGPHQMAQRLNAVCYYAVMLPTGLPHRYVLRVQRLREGQEVQDYVSLLERDIRLHPDQYLWSHNRFKHRYQKLKIEN